MKLKVSEVFESLQGEGLGVGEPSLFVRLSGCNLKCPHCDTRFSWSGGKTVDVSELVEVVRSSRLRRVVFTGGEPTLQASSLIELANRILEFETSMTVETNGTLLDEKVIELFNLVDTISLSPKLPSFSGKPMRVETALDICRRFRDKVYLKFVITKKEELRGPVFDFIKLLGEEGALVPVVLQPDSWGCSCLEEYLERCRKLWWWGVELEKALSSARVPCAGVRVVFQQHRICFWDAERGV